VLKVVHVIDSLGVGGAQTLLLTLAKAIRQRQDLEMAVISLRRRHTVVHDELEKLGVSVTLCPNRGLRNPMTMVGLLRQLRRQRPDVVHTHLLYSNILGGVAAKVCGIAHVATLHNASFVVRSGAKTRRWLEALVLQRCARRRIAVGPLVAKAHRARLAPSEIEVIPNAAPVAEALSSAEIDAVRTEIAGDPSRTILLSLGRLTPQKGYGDLLQAFAIVSREQPETILAIAGQGLLREELEARIVSLGLGGRAFLLGVRQDTQRLLAASDVFVSSSHWEGLPVAVLEAMASGLPIVATAVGDIPQVVIPGTGLVAPAKEPESLASALLDLVGDPQARRTMGLAAQEHVRVHYGVDDWVDRLLTLYGEARRSR
jgi:glycosyltransferase involved in cell wall biosynthesis